MTPAPVATTLTPRPTLVVTATPRPAPTGRPRVTQVTAVGDTITVTFSRAMLQIGEGSGVEMTGNYLLDGRALPVPTNIGCLTRECLIVGIEFPTARSSQEPCTRSASRTWYRRTDRR